MSKSKYSIYYEITLSLLAITTVTITLLDLAGRISSSSYLLKLDSGILVIFAVDYFSRLFISDHKKKFIKSNIFDLIAIIPFSSLFRVFRIARLVRILRVTRIFRMAVFIKKFQRLSKSFVNTNGLIYVIYVTIACILFGSIAIYFAESGKTIDTFADAVWWSFVTATTVGYGDISPESGIGRIIAAILMLTGIGFIGMLTGTIATFFLSPKSKESTMTDSRIVDLSDLNDEDFKYVQTLINRLKDN